jgi:cytochrome c553
MNPLSIGLGTPQLIPNQYKLSDQDIQKILEMQAQLNKASPSNAKSKSTLKEGRK